MVETPASGISEMSNADDGAARADSIPVRVARVV